MKDIRSQEQIDAMRKRLYQRGATTEKTVRHTLSDKPIDVSRNWQTDNTTANTQTNDLRSGLSIAEEPAETMEQADTPAPPKPKRRYRSVILIGSLLIFLFGVGAASLYIYFGGNQISSDNIVVTLDGPSSLGGGEVLPLQVAVTNNNSVPVDSVTLILRYPSGTQSTDENPRTLFEERIPVDSLQPGEAKNIPVTVAVFGEENSEKQIQASIEYRVNGSNGTFTKDANPLAFRISSSPLVLRVESLEKVASGQTVEVVMTAASNASSPLENVLITASYPNGFTFDRSEPAPFYAQNTWKIDKIMPEEEIEITLVGVVRGLTDETFRINFVAGPQDSDNQNQISAALTEAKTDFFIERPFIDVAVTIAGDSDRDVILDQDQNADVSLRIANTLDETVYDMVVEVIPTGNALTLDGIKTNSGFYDSNTGTVRWEVANRDNFELVLPGDTRTLDFRVIQGPEKQESAFELTVNVYARRVDESSAVENLIGSVTTQAKYSSEVLLGSQAGKTIASYVDRGPIPPQVGEESTYTVSLVAEAGANNMSNTIVETSLPLYVDWLDAYDAVGIVTYNSVSKKIQWAVGDIEAGTRKELTMQLQMVPSISQVNKTPIILNSQMIRANDEFTGELLQNTALPVTTELSTEYGYQKDNGVVQP